MFSGQYCDAFTKASIALLIEFQSQTHENKNLSTVSNHNIASVITEKMSQYSKDKKRHINIILEEYDVFNREEHSRTENDLFEEFLENILMGLENSPDFSIQSYQKILKKLKPQYKIKNIYQQAHHYSSLSHSIKIINKYIPSISDYHLMGYAEIFGEKKKISTSEKLDQWMITGMAIAYVGFNIFNLLLGIQNVSHFDAGILSDDKIVDSAGYTWNYFDSVSVFPSSYRLMTQGEWAMGAANFLNSIQLMTSTVIANVAKYSHLFVLTAQAMTALTSFSFAACMAISACIEFYAISQCKKRINQFEMVLERNDISDEEKAIINQAIYIERAKCENHTRAAQAWIACTVAMFAVATVAYIAASAASFGVLPIISIAVTSLAILSGFLRTHWVNQKNHVSEVKKSFEKNKQGESLLTRLEKMINHPPEKYKYLFNPNFIFPSYFSSFYRKSYISYLKELVVKDAKKLEEILDKLDGKPVKNISIPPSSSEKNDDDYLNYINSRGIC
jgi:hypothetical protein